MKAVRMNDTISRCTPWERRIMVLLPVDGSSLGRERALLLFSNHVNAGVTAKYLLKRFSD